MESRKAVLASLLLCTPLANAQAPQAQNAPQKFLVVGVNTKVPVFGGYGYKPTDAETGRIQKFLSTYDAAKKFTIVVIVPNEKFAQAQHDASVPMRRDKIAFTLLRSSRTYINANLLQTTNPDDGVEWALAHELQHLNDPRVPILQEEMDLQIDQLAREGLARWKRKQKHEEARTVNEETGH